MSKFRIFKNSDYTILNNTIFKDKCLSFKAKGILCLMMSLPENWNYTLKGLASLSKDSIDSVRQGVNELKAAGYIVQHQVKSQNGRWAESVYDVYEEPQPSDMNGAGKEEKLPEKENIRQYPTENRSTQNENNLTDLPSLDFPITVNQSTQSDDNLTDLPLLDFPITVNQSTQSDNDLTDLPSLDFPITEKPITENPTQLNTKDINNKYINNPSINLNIDNNIPLTLKMDRMDRSLEIREAYREVVHENVDYEILKYGKKGFEAAQIDEIIELMTDVLSSPKNTMRVSGVEVPTDIVKNRFMKITKEHIEYVIDCINHNTTKIRNIRAYMITSLYNAPATIGTYFSAEASHDMAGEYVEM